MDITFFQGKATYEQIKEYVLQQTGMKVSSLYISQVKCKCGLEVGDCYIFGHVGKSYSPGN